MKPFTDTLSELRGGQVCDEAAVLLREVIAAVRATGRSGSVTIKLSIDLATKGNTDQLLIEDQVTSKVPQADIPSTFLFVDEHMNLSRQDPQQRLAFKHGLAEAPPRAPIVGDKP